VAVLAELLLKVIELPLPRCDGNGRAGQDDRIVGAGRDKRRLTRWVSLQLPPDAVVTLVAP